MQIILQRVKGTWYCVAQNKKKDNSLTWVCFPWHGHLISGIETSKTEPSIQAPTVSNNINEPNVLSCFISIFTNLSLSFQSRCHHEYIIEVKIWGGADGAGPANTRWGSGPRRVCRPGLKLETLHGSFLLLEDKLALILVHWRSQASILLLHTEVVFDQVEGLLVDLLVLVALQELDLVQAWRGAPTYTQFILFLYDMLDNCVAKVQQDQLKCRMNNDTTVSLASRFKNCTLWWDISWITLSFCYFWTALSSGKFSPSCLS